MPASRRIKFGFVIAAIHLCVAMYFVLGLIAGGQEPIADPADGWKVFGFLIFMFPINLLGLFGAFTNNLLAMLLVPINSLIWGFLASRFVPQTKDK